MFIYSFKRQQDLDYNRNILNDNKQSLQSEYFQNDNIIKHYPNSSMRPRGAHNKSTSNSTSKRRANYGKNIKEVESNNQNDFKCPQIHSLKQRLKIYLEDNQVNNFKAEDDNSRQNIEITPLYHNFTNPNRFKKQIDLNFGSQQKNYYLKGSSKNDSEQAIQKFQDKIQTLTSNNYLIGFDKNTYSINQSPQGTIQSRHPRSFRPLISPKKLEPKNYFQNETYKNIMSVIKPDRLTNDDKIYSQFIKPQFNFSVTDNAEPPPSRTSAYDLISILTAKPPKQKVEILQKIKPQIPQQSLTIQNLGEKQTKQIIKLTLYWDFMHLVNLGNDIVVNPLNKDNFIPYRAVITKANNGALVRGCLRYRWWWVLVEKEDNYDKLQLLWSSWKKPKFIKQLKTQKFPNFQVTNDEVYQSPIIIQDVKSKNLKIQDINTQKKRSLLKLVNERQALTIWKKSLWSSKQYGQEQVGPFVFDLQKDLVQSAFEIFPEIKFKEMISNSHMKIHNHLERNSTLHSKKHLLSNLKYYYQCLNQNAFDYIPLTFHICNGQTDKQFIQFKLTYKKLNQETDTLTNMGGIVWIIKPGENSNRGVGIQVCSKLQEIQDIVSQKDYHTNGKRFTYIIQKYIERPMLFNKRKFDIRCYLLVTSVNKRIKAYWYQDAYVRTSSKEYSLKNLENRLVHLTNDAVQKKCDDYGKFESGNKVSIEDFEKFIRKSDPVFDFSKKIWPQMIQMALDSIRSVFYKLDPHHRMSTFELYGLDFMLDESSKPWLIEFNANPCLEVCCLVLNRIIPAMIENVWKIAIDPLFPPPVSWPRSKMTQKLPDNPYTTNKFDLIFDETVEQSNLYQLMKVDQSQALEELSDDDVCDDN